MDRVERERGIGIPWGGVIILCLLAVFLFLPLPLLDKMVAIGFGICPQRAGHSFFLGELLLPGEAALRAAIPALGVVAPAEATKIPLEARMYGMFVGFLFTWVYSFVIGRGKAALMPKPIIMVMYVTFIAIMGFDGINATLFDLNTAGLPIPYAYAPRLDLRLVTGWLCGIAIAGIILPVVNYCLWRDAQAVAMFERLRDMIVPVAAGFVALALFLSGSGLLFYPLAILAPIGVLVTLMSLNVVLVLTLGRKERVASNWREALNPLAVALLLSLVELSLLSAVRFAAFGWGEIV